MKLISNKIFSVLEDRQLMYDERGKPKLFFLLCMIYVNEPYYFKFQPKYLNINDKNEIFIEKSIIMQIKRRHVT